nr:MAG TPA: hypothetical protein [Bacteriophage sp.]
MSKTFLGSLCLPSIIIPPINDITCTIYVQT